MPRLQITGVRARRYSPYPHPPSSLNGKQLWATARWVVVGVLRSRMRVALFVGARAAHARNQRPSPGKRHPSSRGAKPSCTTLRFSPRRRRSCWRPSEITCRRRRRRRQALLRRTPRSPTKAHVRRRASHHPESSCSWHAPRRRCTSLVRETWQPRPRAAGAAVE